MTTATASSWSKKPGMAARVVVAALPIPSGGEEVGEQMAKAVQAVMDVAPVASQAFMEATIEQHGSSPAVALNTMQINMQIQRDSQ